MNAKRKVVNLTLLSVLGVVSFVNPSYSLANDFNENTVIEINVDSAQEMLDIEKKIYEHNQKTKELWNLAALRESIPENTDNSSAITPVISGRAYVTVSDFWAGYSYDYIASYQVSGKRITTVYPLQVRPNASNVTISLEGSERKFLDQQRVVAYITDVRVSVKNLDSGKIRYYTLHDYIEFNYEYKGQKL